MQFSAKTDIGVCRESNQDAYATGVFESGDVWAVVCDGMGGVSGGQIASKLCVEKTSEAIQRGYRSKMSVRAVKNLLNSAICAANSVVFEESQKERALNGMGTTIVAVIVTKGVAVFAHVGDSRAYILNDKIECVTKDHSLVQFLLDSGKITEDEAKVHPERNIITRAVGIMSFVDVEFDIVDLGDDDDILLCTDGLSGSVDEATIYSIIRSNENVADKLISEAIEGGSRDNITAVVLM